jgi:predicted nucleotide-binding protein
MNDVTTTGTDPFFATGAPVSDALPRAAVPEPKTRRPQSNKIFIVHGHEEAPRLAVARFLEHLGLQAIILHERANRGDTLIEKFEAHSDVDFAIVLLTPDDAVEGAGGTAQMRARQNVILEWGYFIAKLGRKNVVALRKGDVELPSDIHGIVWEVFDDHGAWRNVLARELAEVGFNFDWQKVVL